MLLDTGVVIDVLRGREVARRFVKSLGTQVRVSVVSVTEVYAGSRNQQEERTFETLLAPFRIISVAGAESRLAGQFIRHYGRSHGVGPFDALIAATAEYHRLALATLNVKHFPMFPGLKRPY